MDDLIRHVSRLTLIHTMPVAQESLAINAHLKDFVYYYFSRFITNITHVFKDFATPEISDFNLRHKEKIELLLRYPSLSLDGIIVPIPGGMIYSYRKTMQSLLQILEETHPSSIKQDLESLLSVLGTGQIKTLTLPSFTKQQFDTARDGIGKLFGKVGLTHATAAHALVSKAEIKQVNLGLIQTTNAYYKDVIAIHPILKDIEAKHALIKWSDQDRICLAKHLMNTAYRLSILAVVVDHIQETEHAFVKDLKILLTKI